MSFILYICGLLLIGTVAALVAMPLLRPNQALPDLTEDGEQERAFTHWERQKKEAYAVIKEAEFDRQTGKLTDEDYHMLRDKYEARALEAMRQLDQLGQAQGQPEQVPAEQTEQAASKSG